MANNFLSAFKGDAAYSKLHRASFTFWGAPILANDDGTLSCPGYVGKTIADNLYDKVFINAAPTPGIAEVQCNKQRSVDRKKAAGRDGARLTLHGIEPGTGEIRLTIWTPEQLKALNELWPILFPFTGKGDPSPFDVQHPILSQHDVKSIQIVGGEGPYPGQKQGARVFTIRYIEFRPQSKKKATKTPVASKGSTLDVPTRPTPGSIPANTGP